MVGDNLSDREYTDLKERIHYLESQISIKDEQLKNKDNELIEVMKANSNLINSTNGLIQAQINFSKALNPPKEEEAAITIEVEQDKPKESTWFKKLFKK